MTERQRSDTPIRHTRTHLIAVYDSFVVDGSNDWHKSVPYVQTKQPIECGSPPTTYTYIIHNPYEVGTTPHTTPQSVRSEMRFSFQPRNLLFFRSPEKIGRTYQMCWNRATTASSVGYPHILTDNECTGLDPVMIHHILSLPSSFLDESLRKTSGQVWTLNVLNRYDTNANRHHQLVAYIS